MAGVSWETTNVPGIYKRDGARGRRYRVTYRDASGAQIAVTAKTWDAAKEIKRKHSGEDRPQDARAGRRSLRDAFEAQHAARSYSPETLVLHRAAWRYLEPWADTPIAKIGPGDIDQMLGTVSKPVMRERTRALLSVTFNHSIEKGWITRNPVTRPRRRRTRIEMIEQRPKHADRPRHLSNDELHRLLDAIPERYAALVELMARMGLRPGEAYALRVGKFDSLGRRLLIDTSVSGFTKTGLARTLDLPKPIAEMLVDHVGRFSNPSDPDGLIFTTEAEAPIDPDNFRRRTFARAVEQAQIPAVSPNALRHTAAAFAISTGANVYDVTKMLGHAKVSITLDVYGDLFEEQHERFVKAYGEAIERARSERRASSVVGMRSHDA